MNKEIEVRFLEINKNELAEKLIKLGAKDKGENILNETIFYDSDLSWLEEKRFVRLRTIGNVTTLTYKENRGQTIDSAHEVESIVDNPEKMTKLLENVGLIAYRRQEKKRHSFLLGDTAIDIDTWPNIPTYVELEGKSEDAIKEAATKLGFDWAKAEFGLAHDVIEGK